MALALEMGRALSVPLPTTAVTNEMLSAARGADWPSRTSPPSFTSWRGFWG
jgi:hypothetical protein